MDEALKQGKSNVAKAKKTVKAKATAQAETAKKKVAKVKKEVKATTKDDLKLIKGIGPKLEQLFNENGIETFAQLAKASEAKIKSILEKAGPVFKNVNFLDWVKEAQERA